MKKERREGCQTSAGWHSSKVKKACRADRLCWPVIVLLFLASVSSFPHSLLPLHSLLSPESFVTPVTPALFSPSGVWKHSGSIYSPTLIGKKKHLTVFHPSPSLHLSFYLFILPIHLIIHHHHCWSSPASLFFFFGPEFDYGALKVCDFTGPGCDVLYKWNHRCIKMLKKIGKTSVFNPYVSLHCCHSDIPVIAVRVSAGQFTPDKCALCK